MTIARLGAIALLAALLLTGCAVDRIHARRALATATAAQDRTQTCDRADACAQSSPYHALADRALSDSTLDTPVHYAELLDRGEDSLLVRIHLIRSAGRVPAQRATTYEHLVVHDDPANDPPDPRVHSHFSSTALTLTPAG